MIEVDQFNEYTKGYTEEERKLAKCVELLVSEFYNDDGTLKDWTDKSGRERLIQAINGIPKEVPAFPSEEYKKLLQEEIKLMKVCITENRKSRDLMKVWFWWVIGMMTLGASITSLFIGLLLK